MRPELCPSNCAELRRCGPCGRGPDSPGGEAPSGSSLDTAGVEEPRGRSWSTGALFPGLGDRADAAPPAARCLSGHPPLRGPQCRQSARRWAWEMMPRAAASSSSQFCLQPCKFPPRPHQKETNRVVTPLLGALWSPPQSRNMRGFPFCWRVRSRGQELGVRLYLLLCTAHVWLCSGLLLALCQWCSGSPVGIESAVQPAVLSLRPYLLILVASFASGATPGDAQGSLLALLQDSTWRWLGTVWDAGE